MASLQYREIRYSSESHRQIVGVWELPENEQEAADSDNRFWLVYIHGGAWRDPSILTDSAIPAIDRMMETTSSQRRRFAGFASLGYRLSPYPPDEPQDSIQHPEHLRDVWMGLAALAADGQTQTSSPTVISAKAGSPADYLMSGRYVVYGHSAGAFLAYQLWMGEAAAAGDKVNSDKALLPCNPLPFPPPPHIVVGLEGIYDLYGLVNRGADNGRGVDFQDVLRQIVQGSFGLDHAAWDAASPGKQDWVTTLSEWGRRHQNIHQPSRPCLLAVLAYSSEDELVDPGEIDTMEASLRRALETKQQNKIDTNHSSDKINGVDLHILALRDLHGKHDEIWNDGREVARVLCLALTEWDQLQSEDDLK